MGLGEWWCRLGNQAEASTSYWRFPIFLPQLLVILPLYDMIRYLERNENVARAGG